MTLRAVTRLTSGEEARSLRTVLDLLLQDIPLRPVDPATLPWDRPILILRSANMGRLRPFSTRSSYTRPHRSSTS